MNGRLERVFAATLLVAACSHGSSAPEPAAAPAEAPASAPGPRAVTAVSPADVHRAPRGAPAAPAAAAPAASPAPQAEPALYWRLGGAAAIAIVVDTFTARVHGDTTLAPLFRGVDMDNFKRLLREQLCEATGGGCHYSGRSMPAAHTGLNITNAQFDTVVGYLAATLDQFNVPAREKNELLGALGGLRGDIVGH